MKRSWCLYHSRLIFLSGITQIFLILRCGVPPVFTMTSERIWKYNPPWENDYKDDILQQHFNRVLL